MPGIAPKKIAFIGPSGSGKSAVSRVVARHSGCGVFDTDAEFTRRHGSISEYFRVHGEARFRALEEELILEAARSDKKIVSCGGGAVLSPRAMASLRATADIVLLYADANELKKRIGHSDRPLVASLDEIIAARAPLYERYADYAVNTDGIAVERAAELVENIVKTPRPNRYDILLCDSDDTLLDFRRAMRGSVIASARAVGVRASDSDIVRTYSEILPVVWGALERGEITRDALDGIRFEMFAERLGENIDVRRMNELYIREMTDTRFVIDGAKEFLTAVRGRGIKVYVVTNSFSRIASCRKHALDGYTDGWFISEEIGFDKPDARFYERVFEKIGKPDRSRVLAVGDSLTSDIAGGRNAGLDTCLYSPSGGTGGDYSVKSYDELLAIL